MPDIAQMALKVGVHLPLLTTVRDHILAQISGWSLKQELKKSAGIDMTLTKLITLEILCTTLKSVINA